jgi:adenine-specific DNA-methyltransferase
LSTSIVEGPQERYQLNWPGKREALLTANAPIAKTLRPCREESVDFDTTQNLFIEGDNLDALKLLQETYLNKVKVIYIDPPYNTGNDFIYEDDFAEDADSYFMRSHQKDEVIRFARRVGSACRAGSNADRQRVQRRATP